MTVLRLKRTDGVLIHTPLDSPADDGIDFTLDLPWPLVAPSVIPGQQDVMIEPSAHPGVVHITRGQQDLWADPRRPEAVFCDRIEGRFEFLLVDEQALAHLRALVRHRWVRGTAEDGPQITFVPEWPFVLNMGLSRLDLRARMPHVLSTGDSFELHTERGEITITRVGEARAEIQLHKRAAIWQPPRTASLATFQSGQDCWLRIEGAEEFTSLPITVCNADRDWMYKNPYGRQDHIVGRNRCRPYIAGESGKYVALTRFAEGVVFDENGVCNEDGYLEGYGYRGAIPMLSPPAGMRCEQGRLFLDRATLSSAPFIEGDTIVFILGTLSNYTHWLIDGLLVLHMLLDYVPAGAKLLLPGTIREMQSASRRVIDHYDTLRAFGWAGLPTVEIAEPYCRLEHAYWLESESVFSVPATYMQSLRARVARLRPPPARRDGRIYIARRVGRRIANAEMLDPFLERQGFTTHYLEDYSFDQQIDMFSQAEWVIGPHGAELGNLLFCHPGTKVLELAPEFDFKPYFSYMCNKLGLTHGVLPCPTTDGKFNGDIILNMPKFAALFRMLKNRL